MAITMAQEQVEGAEGPGVALLNAHGQVRWASPLLLMHLGLARLPERVETLERLLELASFHPAHALTLERPGLGSVWQRDGRTLLAGEVALPDGQRQLWTLPYADDLEPAERRVRYLSLASHDLRGMLANVRSYVGLLLSPRHTHEPKVRRSLETIARNTDRALTFSQDFFDAARAELGGLAHERELLPLLPLVMDCVSRFEDEARAAGIPLELEAPAELPSLHMDAGRLTHALSALMAHQLARAQTGEHVRVRASVADGAVRVDVRRRGTPEPQEELEHLFDHERRALRERRVEDAQRLWLARAEVQLHGGELTCSNDDGGTTLTLRLPV